MDPADPVVLLGEIYGDVLQLHFDLYEKSERHRLQHGTGCTVYPSSPVNIPMWHFLTAVVGARRFLEVGCGLGYTAAIMAEVGGPECRVDTIESLAEHADLAEAEFQRRRLTSQIHVLRGLARDVVSGLAEPYDIVFADADEREYPELLSDFIRLTRLGGVLVTANISPERIDWSQGVREYLTRLVQDPRFRTFIIPRFWRALSYRVRNASNVLLGP